MKHNVTNIHVASDNGQSSAIDNNDYDYPFTKELLLLTLILAIISDKC